jgi:hypothetical protein
MEEFLAFVIANQQALIAIIGSLFLTFTPVVNTWFSKLSSAQRFWLYFTFAMSQAIGLGLWQALQAGWPGWEAIPAILLDALLAWLAGSGWHLIYSRYKRDQATAAAIERLAAKQRAWEDKDDKFPL